MTPRALQSSMIVEQAKLADLAVKWVRATDAKAEARKRLQHAKAAFYRPDRTGARALLIEYRIGPDSITGDEVCNWFYTAASDQPPGSNANADPIVLARDAAYMEWRKSSRAAGAALRAFRQLARRAGTTTVQWRL